MTRFVLLKAIGGPGSLGFLVCGVVLALVLLRFARTRRLGGMVLIALAVGYLALSIPAIALVAGDGVTAVQPGPAPPIEKFGDVFVLDGDNYRARAKRAGELYVEIAPRMVWILGGQDLKSALIDRGIPEERLQWGGLPHLSTHGQMVRIRELMTQHAITRPVVVASRIQTRRVAGLARRQGIDAIVIASRVDDEPATTGVGRWIPSLNALALSREALYEWVALGYYGWKGWTE